MTVKRFKIAVLAAGLVAGISLLPRPALAQTCENPATATTTFNTLAQNIVTDLNLFIQQEQNFMDQKISRTAAREINTRLDEFDRNIREGFAEWWHDHYLPAMQGMASQNHAAVIDQNRVVGSLLDAHMMNEAVSEAPEQMMRDRQRYAPSETTCQLDSMVADGGPTKAFRLARALTRAFAKESENIRLNRRGTQAARGVQYDLAQRWSEYLQYFCDPSSGDVRCDTPGTMAGRHTDIPALLWGDKQSVDLGRPENRMLVNTAMRTMISPRAQDPVPRDKVSGTIEGKRELMRRRTEATRKNAVYNVMGQMLGERSTGSGVSSREAGEAAGVDPANSSEDASYQELMRVMGKDRFHDPEYAVRIVQSPEQLVREQGAINAVRMQQLSNLYKRMEEMVFMEAAVLADDLDKNVPSFDTTSTMPQ